LAERQPELVTVDGWRAIEADELARGRAQQRPRVKLTTREELLSAARNGRETAVGARTRGSAR
jgi:ferredoxin--NADP+ reductase